MADNPIPSPALVYSLETPIYHLLELNAENRFSGFVFNYEEKILNRIDVYGDQKKIGSFAVSGLSQDIHAYVPDIKSAERCRFDFALFVSARVSTLLFEVVYQDSSKEVLFEYPVGQIVSMSAWLEKMKKNLSNIPMPDEHLVFLTQGIHNSQAYQDSIIPGMYNVKRYLMDSGIDLESIQTILDLGCGTGRLIAGLHADNPQRHLFGCDINKELLAWAMANLPPAISWHQGTIAPPLPYKKKFFDLVCMVSVFTHLSLDCQKKWIAELHRIIKPGGCILVTLHGELYVRLLQTRNLEKFITTGYTEISSSDEGSNAYATYHDQKFAAGIFEGFTLLKFYPRGMINWPEVPFPVAAFQDVYVFKRL